MGRWLRQRWWLTAIILAIALIIGWKEKRCQAHAYECRSQYAAELSSIPPNQKAAEQEAIAAACEPNSYFCRLFSAANLPNVGLLLAGTVGIYIALGTLKAIKSQTEATADSVKAIREQTEASKATARASVLVDIEWQLGRGNAMESDGAQGKTTGIFVRCLCANEGRSIAQVSEKGYVFGIVATLPVEPDFSHIDVFHHACEYIKPDNTSEPYNWLATCQGHRRPNSMMVLYGRVKYKDVFGERETRFGYIVTPMGNLERLPAESYPEYNKHT